MADMPEQRVRELSEAFEIVENDLRGAVELMDEGEGYKAAMIVGTVIEWLTEANKYLQRNLE